MLKKVFSVFLNFAVFGAMWFGVNGNTYAWNFARFMIWFGFVTYFILFLGMAVKPKRTIDKVLPSWFTVTMDILGVVTLATFGQFLYASLWAFQAIVEYQYFRLEKETK